MFDPSQFETEDLREGTMRSESPSPTKLSKKPSRTSKCRYSLVQQPLGLDLNQRNGVLSSHGNQVTGSENDNLSTMKTRRKKVRSEIVEEDDPSFGNTADFQTENLIIDEDELSKRVYQEEEGDVIEAKKFFSQMQQFSSKDYITPPNPRKQAKPIPSDNSQQSSNNFNSFVKLSDQSSEKEQKLNIMDAEQYYKLSNKKEDKSSEEMKNSVKSQKNMKANWDSLENQLSQMYARNRVGGTTKDTIDIHGDESSRNFDFLEHSKKIVTLTPRRKKRCLKRRFKIPNNMEKRVKARKNRSRTPSKSPNKRKSRKSKTPTKLYNFKRSVNQSEMTNVRVGLDLLHTDELLKYYKEVVSKSKMDYVAHHREQNFVKKLEYNYLYNQPESPNK
jgi:hypothetical protein